MNYKNIKDPCSKIVYHSSVNNVITACRVPSQAVTVLFLYLRCINYSKNGRSNSYEFVKGHDAGSSINGTFDIHS